MKKVAIFSLLLIAGMAGSQLLPPLLGEHWAGVAAPATTLLTMVCLSFIMIHVGFEFDVDRTRLRSYGVDFGVAASAAILPWLFCSLWFLLALPQADAAGRLANWKDALVAGCFAAPTSAGILFAMLAAAGLARSWMFGKARLLAIFDDLVTVLLMIPLKALLVGFSWQLGAVVVVMVGLVFVGWKWLHRWRWPVTWPWVVTYSIVLTALSEAIYHGSKLVDDTVPIHLEILLPAFVLGCVLVPPHAHTQEPAPPSAALAPANRAEARVATLVSALFMVLVGLAMPSVAAATGGASLGTLFGHMAVVTLLANAGKMVPLFCYRGETGWRERLALSIGMWPRGEVGAGVLVISLSYGVGGMMVGVATLSLALNLLLTGLFIAIARRLIAK
jgi:Kef-type K+ transport system membrane component KefB